MSFRVIDPDAVPDEFCEITVTMPVELWLALCRRSDFKWSTPALSLIEAESKKPCPLCANPNDSILRDFPVCPECGGSGHPRIARNCIHYKPCVENK